MKTRVENFVVFLSICISACSSPEKELAFKMQDDLSAADVKLAEQGVKTLIKACPGIEKYWGDLLQHSPVSVKSASLTDERELGWQRSVGIILRASVSPNNIPASFRANGHICYFEVGISAPYGVSIAKSACAAICKSTEQKASYLFVPAK